MRAVFDLDDTICRHHNRDYDNAVPILETIEKMKRLKADGWEICINSARGQHSCRGDLALIEERNREQVERWLAKHNVPCDELRFGKPLGDIYIDDKAMSLADFNSSECQQLRGNSGAEIYRIGNMVVKTDPKAADTAAWYEKADDIGVYVPRVSSVVLDNIYIEYIDGESGAERDITNRDLCSLIGTIMTFSLAQFGVFSVDALIDRAKEHLSHWGRERWFKHLFSYMESNRKVYQDNSSFCHGDLSLSNTIFSGERIYLIDPIVNVCYSSYLMDFAKLRFSMDGGEKFLHGSSISYEKPLEKLDRTLMSSGMWEPVVALEATYWIRLMKYTEELERREEIIQKAQSLEAWL